MGRNIHEIIEKEIEGCIWQRTGEYICGSYSKFAEQLIPWDVMDMEGCGTFNITPKYIVAAAWDSRHDSESKEDIHAMLTWLHSWLNAKNNTYTEYANDCIKFHIS